MRKDIFVPLLRGLTAWFIIAVVIFPTAYGAFFILEKTLSRYDTLHLVSITLVIVGVSVFVLVLEPHVARLVKRTLFQGSFSYQEDIRKLSAQILEDATIVDPLDFMIQQLKKSVGVTDIKFDSNPSSDNVKPKLPAKTLSIPLRITSDNKGALLSGPKNNTDQWSRADRRLLLWFSRTAEAMLRLDLERQEAQAHIEQLRKESLRQTTALKNLNTQLNRRDESHARRLDQLAHDLRNPITYMHMSLEEAKWDKQEVDRQIAENIQWLNKFVGHMLELSRAEAGKVELENQPVNVSEILHDLALTDQRVQIKIPDNVTIKGDDMLLLRAFSLLISQALLISKEQVRISLEQQPSNILVSITSEPFETIDVTQLQRAGSQYGELLANHTSRKLGLTGLELHVCRWIAEAHRGSLQIDTQNDLLAVTLVLPL